MPVVAPPEAELEVPPILMAETEEDVGLPNDELRDIEFGEGERGETDDDVRLVSGGIRSVRLFGSELLPLPFPGSKEGDIVAVGRV